MSVLIGTRGKSGAPISPCDGLASGATASFTTLRVLSCGEGRTAARTCGRGHGRGTNDDRTTKEGRCGAHHGVENSRCVTRLPRSSGLGPRERGEERAARVPGGQFERHHERRVIQQPIIHRCTHFALILDVI